MPPSFQRDPECPTGVRFTCSACGIAFCRRVMVKRPDGSTYKTEFVSCDGCMVLFHWPGDVPTRPVVDPRRSARSSSYPAMSMGSDWTPTGGMTEEDLTRIKETAERVQRSKGKRYRR